MNKGSLVGRRRAGRTMPLASICFVEAIIPDESWEGISEGSGVSSKRRIAGRRVEGEGKVPRTARVCVKASYRIVNAGGWMYVRIHTHFGLECGQTRTA